MSPRHRALHRLGAAAALVLLTAGLSGCFTLRMDLAVQPDDTVDGSVVLAVDQSLAAAAGGEQALLDGLTGGGSPFPEPPSAGDVQQREYRDGDLVGVEYVLTGVPVEDFASQGGGDLSITREGDRFVVTGSVNLSDGDPASGGPDVSQILGTADITLSLTFPGDVVDTNGRVAGRTVTWQPQVGQENPINAVALASGGLDLRWVGVGLVLVLGLVALGAVLALRGRASVERAAGPDTVLPGPAGSHTGAAPADGALPRATQVIPVDERLTQVVDRPPDAEEPRSGG
jgi:hypothetical protein